jgi:tetratricopeptide (TPR) repeat protein
MSPETAVARAITSLRAGRLDDAEQALRKVLRQQKRHAGALNLLGVLLSRQGRFGEAAKCMEAAIDAGSASDATFYNYGIVLKALGRPANAVDQFTRALSTNDTVWDTWNARGTAFNDLRRYADAIADFDRAIAQNPKAAAAHSNKGNSLTALRKFDDARASFEIALALNPNLGGAWAGRGRLLFDLNDYDAADVAFEQAIALEPDLAFAWLERGNLQTARNRPEEAIHCFRRAQEAAPELREAHFAEAFCRLKFGDTAEGWKKYEWRGGVDQIGGSPDKPLWLGDRPISGKSILLHAQQGFGDAIQFCRFVKPVSDLGARVTLEVQPELKSLLEKLPGPDRLMARGEPRPAYDLHCPLGSLPLALQIDPGRLDPAPYLSAPPVRIEEWRRRLDRVERPRIGIAWAGNPSFRSDHNRSIGLMRLLPAVSAIQARFISLQKNANDDDKSLLRMNGILDYESHIGDFVDTAALMSCLDLVISSDTSVVHLAGALGTKVWVLLRYDADWRWLAERTDSPWYPSARLFRQQAPGDWGSVVDQVVGCWRELVSSRTLL